MCALALIARDAININRFVAPRKRRRQRGDASRTRHGLHGTCTHAGANPTRVASESNENLNNALANVRACRKSLFQNVCRRVVVGERGVFASSLCVDGFSPS